MRTTLDLDEDVLLAAKEHAARERKSLGSVISELARQSLRRPPQPSGRRGGRKAGGRFAVLPQRDEVITVEHVRGLQDAEGV
ncbi:MAG TPA: CopG family transcriptional regulator [Ramlibacter sp.]|nr:CopG family transcriptional regulator [Ramlibacter sp.]